MKHPRALTLAALTRAQHSQDSSLYSSYMSELGIHVSSLQFKLMFELIVKLRKLVKLLRMHDKSTHIYIYTYPYGKRLARLFYSPTLIATGYYVPLQRQKLYVVNTVSNQCKMETAMLLCFCCFLLMQGESC